ncbi:MAG: transposase [Lachnospiraceae bacterium]|nr:transposase [Lachnospiraceae bacterium]
MPRVAREKSITGFYHVMVRGVGKQIIFEEANDYYFYLKMLEKYATETEIEICAYCLMDNHVHLLVRDVKDNLALFMKKLGVVYAIYYNTKYERNGHLFQDRYKSKAINDERYLLIVFSYILNNPKSAGIDETNTYRWSSYRDYKYRNGFTSIDFIMNLLGNVNIDNFLKLENEITNDYTLEENCKISENAAIQIVRETLGVESGKILLTYPKDLRDKYIKELKNKGLSTRQISRLTGISRGVVIKA